MKNYTFAVITAASLAMAGCSQQSRIEKVSQEFNSLPPAVQQTVRSQAPNAEIASADRKTRNGIAYYVIEFKEPGRNPKLTIAENGVVLSGEPDKAMGASSGESGTISGRSTKSDTDSTLGAPKGTTGKVAPTDLSSLPSPVQKTLKSKVPDGVIKSISRHDDNGRVVYEFEFEDQGKNPTMRIADDGTVVQTLKK